MRLNEITFRGTPPVDGYGPGFFRIGGQLFDGALALLPDGPAAWGGFADTAAIAARAGQIDVLLVGTGDGPAPLPAKFRTDIEAAGIGVEFMATASACRTYNILLAEGRRVAAVLLPVSVAG